MKSLKMKIAAFNQIERDRLMSGKVIEDFRPGDVISVEYKQNAKQKDNFFVGTCIGVTKKGIMSKVTVLKMSSHGVQIVRSFITSHPSVISIKLNRKAKKHNRAKLYYLKSKADKV
ncbi:50S ribosomal protein L19 [Candidatus Deianiraea vastatrix]|uniref:50S ribosomal protein L19 n=1 Tax=Candidatus Deianiraea vastatrix TaxID=2163644 RepID=A0A5B8XDK9_9RICK|nr:50S ribosomal protein L19 [Candidatus Deianiraea vastatrix]QED22965.1 50S ribosomal protein L19 [Candidatus Deianiraea vastatrix]